MSDEELAQLQNPDNWDTENIEYHEGDKNKNRRTIVSVAFPREDFKKVASEAARLGMNVSTYIRQAALGKIRHPDNHVGIGVPQTYAAPSRNTFVLNGEVTEEVNNPPHSYSIHRYPAT